MAASSPLINQVQFSDQEFSDRASDLEEVGITILVIY
jgi:hypothetical protein